MAGKITVLTIAGSDSGAGAGIQSDIKTFKNHGVYGVTVITSVTAQNTKGVQSAYELPARVIDAQLKSVFADMKIKAVKTGMMSSHSVINTAVKYLKDKKNLKIIVDPVIFSKNGFVMLSKNGIKTLVSGLLPLSYLVTPNIPETEILTGIKINSFEDLETAAVALWALGVKNVLIKGGHMKKDIGYPAGTDVLFDGKKFYLFNTAYIRTGNTHGIGCSLSAAITANLATGLPLVKSIESAKQYIVKSLKKTAGIGRGSSPVEQ